jgi:photosystem II stability/assembly factor-like uncharacterized protein
MAEFTWSPTDPDTVWVGSMSGPMVSTDGGRTWTPSREGFPALEETAYSAPVEQILFDPASSEHLLAFGGSQRRWGDAEGPNWGAVWESHDGGATWARKADVVPGGNVVAATYLGASGTDLLAAVDQYGVYRSSDGGATWTVSVEGLPHLDARDLAAHPTDGARAWVALGGGDAPGALYTTADGGLTWTPAAEGLGSHDAGDDYQRSRYEAVAVAPGDPAVLYTADASWDVPAVYRSGDGGATWQRILDLEALGGLAYQSRADFTELAVDPANPQRIVAASSEHILGSDDGGETWRDLASAETDDGGFVGRGFSGLVTTDIAFNPWKDGVAVLSAMDGGNGIVTTDGGHSFRRPLAAADSWGGAYDTAYASQSVVYALLGQAGTFNGIGKSSDGGETWTVIAGSSHGLPERGVAEGPTPASIHAFDEQRVIATIFGCLYTSPNGGDAWVRGKCEANLGSIDGPPGADVAYVLGSAGVYRTTDAAETLELLAGSPASAPADGWLTVAPNDEAHVLVTQWRVEGGGLFETRDAGESWSQLLDDDHVYRAAVSPESPDTMIAVVNDHPYHDESRGGVFWTTDGGATWSDCTDGLAMRRASVVAFDPHTPSRIVVGTQGNGFWERTAPCDAAASGAGG